jgi:hypothetical protein
MIGLRAAVLAAMLMVARLARVVGAEPLAASPPVRPALPVLARGGDAVAVIEGLFGDASVTFSVGLQNTGPDPIEVVPIFASAARVDKIDRPAYQIATFAAPRTGPATPIAVGGIQTLEVPLDGIDEAGVYAVETVFGDPRGTYQPHAVKATVYRREAWLRAALAILLGAALAWGIRAYLSDGSRRLALRRRIALLEAQLRVFRAGARGEDLVVAARVLELDVLDRERDVRWGGNLVALDDVTARAEQRFALLQDIAAATERLVRIDADQQVEPRKTLEDALVVVRIDPGDRLAIDGARDRVGKLGLTALRRAQLRGWLAELETQLAAQDRVAVTPLTGVAATVASARDFLRTGALDELEAAIRAGRAQLLDASIAGLAERAKLEPLGVTGWSATADQIRAKLLRGDTPDWAARTRAFQDAQALYFAAAVSGLIAAATRRAAAGDSRAERFRAIAQELGEAAAKDPMLAAARYADLLAEVSAPDPALARPANLLGPGGAVAKGYLMDDKSEDEVAPAPAGWIPYVPGDLTQGVWKPTEVRALDRLISSSRWLVNAGVMLIAVASGVKILWLDNLAWGGHGAWLIAFLWGSGVQLTGDTCAGFLAVRARLGAAAPAA